MINKQEFQRDICIGERFTSTTNSFIVTTVTHIERRRQLCIRYFFVISEAVLPRILHRDSRESISKSEIILR